MTSSVPAASTSRDGDVGPGYDYDKSGAKGGGNTAAANAAKEKPPTPLVYGLFCVFGVSAWVAINGTFGELPILATTLPEGWSIANVLAVCIQLANVFPLAYLCLTCCRRQPSAPTAQQAVPVIFGLIALGVVASLFTAALWDTITDGRSLALMVLTFISGGVDCTTSVVYWPYVAAFRTPYVSALAVGGGMSGVVASLLTLAQSPGVDNRFSVGTFFVLLAIVMAISGVAFAALTWLPAAKAERRAPAPNATITTKAAADDETGAPGTLDDAERGTSGALSIEAGPASGSEGHRQGRRQSRREVLAAIARRCQAPLLVLCWASFVQNGLLVSIRTYATLPFLNGSEVLFWAGTLVTLIDPAAAALTTWPKLRTQRLGAVTSSWSALAFLVVLVALSSPNPPLADTEAGGILIVLILVATRCLLAYTRAMAVIVMYQRLAEAPEAQRSSGGTMVGIAIQVGALVGSLLLFALIQSTTLFVEKGW